MTTDVFVDREEATGLFVVTNNGDEVPVGTRFTKLLKFGATDDPMDGTFVELGSLGTVDLVLKEVDLFRKRVEAIPKGWSAAIRLEGAGMDAIRLGLAGKRKGEYVHLR
jgi:hypothetical protein